MQTEGFNLIEILSQYVTFIKESIKPKEGGIYPALGAHGSEFVVELATGAKITRYILTIIVIEFGEIYLDYDACRKALANRSEVFLKVPDSAHMIAFLGLLESAFNDNTKILHPLSNTGDFLPDWEQAI